MLKLKLDLTFILADGKKKFTTFMDFNEPEKYFYQKFLYFMLFHFYFINFL